MPLFVIKPLLVILYVPAVTILRPGLMPEGLKLLMTPPEFTKSVPVPLTGAKVKVVALAPISVPLEMICARVLGDESKAQVV